MPKTKPIESALHDWVHTLTFQQQALLMTGMRGPDGCDKHNPAKRLVRFLRGAICKPAGNWDGQNNNDFMWGDYRVFQDEVKAFFADPDGYPHHFIMHLIHCAEVIGYKHPDSKIACQWKKFYLKACHSFHMTSETEPEMDDRLNDFGVPIPAASPVIGDKPEEIAEELFDKYSEHIDDNSDSFGMVAGTSIVTRSEFKRCIIELLSQPAPPSVIETGEHIHVNLPSGGVARVSQNASPELLGALDKMVELAKKMPETGEKDTWSIVNRMYQTPLAKGGEFPSHIREVFHQAMNKLRHVPDIYVGDIEPPRPLLQRATSDYYLKVTVTTDLLPENQGNVRANISSGIYRAFDGWKNTGVTVDAISDMGKEVDDQLAKIEGRVKDYEPSYKNHFNDGAKWAFEKIKALITK